MIINAGLLSSGMISWLAFQALKKYNHIIWASAAAKTSVFKSAKALVHESCSLNTLMVCIVHIITIQMISQEHLRKKKKKKMNAFPNSMHYFNNGQCDYQVQF